MQLTTPSELRYRDFFENVPVGLFAISPQGRILDANPAMVAILRYPSLVELLEADIADFQIDSADAARMWSKLHEGGEIRDLEVQLGRADGSTVWLLTSASAARDDEGQILYYRGAVEDITGRKQAEEAERRIARRFCDLFESSPDAIFVQDLEGNILDANPVACSLCGETHGELVGRNMAGLITEESLAELLGGVPGLSRGEVVHAEATVRGGNGRATPVAISGSRIEYTGRPALLLHARDTSEQKRLQEQFHQSQKMEAIGRLAGGIAHDFNNLLTAIIGYNEIVLGGLHERDPLRRSSEEVRMAAERAARLTKQLLAVSRKQTLQPRIVDMNGVVTDIEKMLRRLIGDDIELSVIPSPKSACVRADPSQIEQVIINLAVNARDAMPSGGQLFVRVSSIALSTPLADAPDLTPGSYIVLRVTDTGFGMSDEVQARVFEPFFTTKEPGKGTGLGLATCYGIVKQSGGRILCDSAPNRGATFSIYLPQVLGTAEAARPETGVAPPLPRGTESILIVEDAVGVRGLATRILRSLGYRLLEAENGFDALSVISQHGMASIDLILTDVTMPKMGGRELIERVWAEHPATRVVFTSGAPGADAALKTLFSHPGTAFLHKPFTPADLARVIRTVIEPEPAAHHNGNGNGNGVAVALDI